MLNQLKNLKARVGDGNAFINRWLLARKQLLVAYYNLAGLTPGKSGIAALDEKALDDFCQGLVDYLSTGHFTIYERIIHEMEGKKPLATVCKIWPQLEANTQQIMNYYDTHLETVIGYDNFHALQPVLSELGEALAARFALEDKLIVLVLNNDLKASSEDNIARPA
ncbi:sigma D regulator [Apirhabdus apintestini]|uniref:sigma D regulator n=1 Tax=Erwinia sp. HR93 TaxID=3094840 RepID=UPI002ADEC834|nr:sigma D regulator [Erwinia sp. HR93]MEA1062590.1 sigma D regulator [Erwinia sp. HR93]WPM84984.1 sigma D regulator [Enterobacteriaceae bacterium CA-0114]